MRTFLRLFLLFFAALNTGYSQEPASKQLVKIGIIMPLTGGEARRGDDVAKLVRIVAPRINQTNERYEFQFLIEDGKCGAGSAATTAASKYLSFDKVKFLLTGCSGETLQAAPLAERARVITVAIMSLHPDIRKLGDLVFRTYIDVEDSLDRFVRYLKAEVPGRVAVLTEENAFTFGIRDSLRRRLGRQLAMAEDFPADSADFNTLLVKVKGSGVNAVYFNAMSEGTLAILVNQARALDLPAQIFSYAMPETPSFRRATGANSNGIEFLGTPVIRSESEDFKAVHEEYMRRHPEGPSFDFLLRTAYDAIGSVVDAVNAVGTDSAKAAQFLKTYRKRGALGEIEYDETGDVRGLHFVLKRMKDDGTIEVVDDLNARAGPAPRDR